MTEQREGYTTEPSLVVPRSVTYGTILTGAQRITQLEGECEQLRAEIRRLRVLWLWQRGDLTSLETREALGLPKGTVNSALHSALAEARKALGLEGEGG